MKNRTELRALVNLDLRYEGTKLEDYKGKDLKSVEVFTAYPIPNRLEGCGYNLAGLSYKQIENLYWSELDKIINSPLPKELVA